MDKLGGDGLSLQLLVGCIPVAAPKGVEVVTALGPFDPEDVDRGNAVWILPDRVHEALHLGLVQHRRQRPDEHAQRHIVHGGDAARVDAAALRAAARPRSLGRPPARPGSSQRSSRSETHHSAVAAAWAFAGRATSTPML